jgi:polyhydroxybutyrate depolymerase
MRRYIALDAIAEREGFVVAYPDGIGHHWNDGRPELDGTADDVAFIAALIDELAATYSLDRARVYVTGISNGAIMAYRLACELPDRIAAIAPVAGDVPLADLARCRPHAKVSVLAINGTDDPLVPFDGGIAGRGGQVMSAPDSVAVFARAAGCGPDRTSVDVEDRDPDDHTRSQRTTYTRCPPSIGEELITVENGGHTWPGAAQYLPRVVIGAASRDFSASEALWAFFAAHRHTDQR